MSSVKSIYGSVLLEISVDKKTHSAKQAPDVHKGAFDWLSQYTCVISEVLRCYHCLPQHAHYLFAGVFQGHQLLYILYNIVLDNKHYLRISPVIQKCANRF